MHALRFKNDNCMYVAVAAAVNLSIFMLMTGVSIGSKMLMRRTDAVNMHYQRRMKVSSSS